MLKQQKHTNKATKSELLARTRRREPKGAPILKKNVRSPMSGIHENMHLPYAT